MPKCKYLAPTESGLCENCANCKNWDRTKCKIEKKLKENYEDSKEFEMMPWS